MKTHISFNIVASASLACLAAATAMTYQYVMALQITERTRNEMNEIKSTLSALATRIDTQYIDPRILEIERNNAVIVNYGTLIDYAESTKVERINYYKRTIQAKLDAAVSNPDKQQGELDYRLNYMALTMLVGRAWAEYEEDMRYADRHKSAGRTNSPYRPRIE